MKVPFLKWTISFMFSIIVTLWSSVCTRVYVEENEVNYELIRYNDIMTNFYVLANLERNLKCNAMKQLT